VLLLAVMALAAHDACAARLTGKVVGISDGDTLTVLDTSHEPHKVRLVGIDAPEKAQMYSERAKQHLAALAYDKNVTVEWHGIDRYGRLIGKVSAGGVDVGLDQIRKGYAWHYKQFILEQAVPDRGVYAKAETAARAARKGLWQEANPVPPWAFRHHHARTRFLRTSEEPVASAD
jgi:endonuclease YncB( thermonuclease family)